MNDFERILTGLRFGEVSFVVVGGVAATVHGSARLTSDVDVVYERSLPNIERRELIRDEKSDTTRSGL